MSEPTQVWLVYLKDYEDLTFLGVFSNEKDAEEVAKIKESELIESYRRDEYGHVEIHKFTLDKEVYES